jgi:hypothetical protein
LEIANEPHAGQLDGAHSIPQCFFEGTEIIPVIMIDAVGGNDGTGAVRSATAVHKYRAGCTVL